ncbi:MAG TPA: hypothetical protein VL961_12150, partial [Acidimicrobiales bacterium]|nr:hypothetical protein [Acidimicrobiales bacterium]
MHIVLSSAAQGSSGVAPHCDACATALFAVRAAADAADAAGMDEAAVAMTPSTTTNAAQFRRPHPAPDTGADISDAPAGGGFGRPSGRSW